jgi:hypothetical protein
MTTVALLDGSLALHVLLFRNVTGDSVLARRGLASLCFEKSRALRMLSCPGLVARGGRRGHAGNPRRRRGLLWITSSYVSMVSKSF